MAISKFTKSKSRKTMYSVLRGVFDDAPEQVTVIGLFTSIEDARKRVLKEYRSFPCVNDYDDEPNQPRIPRSFRVLDNGHEFWTITTHRV